MQFIKVCSPFPRPSNASNGSFVSGYNIPVNGLTRFSASGSASLCRGLIHQAIIHTLPPYSFDALAFAIPGDFTCGTCKKTPRLDGALF